MPLSGWQEPLVEGKSRGVTPPELRIRFLQILPCSFFYRMPVSTFIILLNFNIINASFIIIDIQLYIGVMSAIT